MSDANKRTSINLDDETAEIAKRLGNRSEFVRECLRRWNAWDTGAHVHPTETDKCFPLSRKGVCLLCWPDGPPLSEDWKYYRESGGKVVTGQTKYKMKNQIGETYNPIFANDHPYANDWIEGKARDANSISQFGIPKDEKFNKPRVSPKKIGFFASIRQKIRDRGD
tara:strand:+ start:348 stop:845 length:498 start_codon:yes stop_codon:yes gene_type:complete